MKSEQLVFSTKYSYDDLAPVSYHTSWMWALLNRREVVIPPVYVPQLPLTQIQSLLRLIQSHDIDLEELMRLSLELEAPLPNNMYATGPTVFLVSETCGRIM